MKWRHIIQTEALGTKFEKRKDLWLGSLHCEVNDPEIEALFKPFVVVSKRYLPGGVVSLKYADGHIEMTTQAEWVERRCKELSEEILEASKR